MKEILSSDPELRGRKEAIGREFMDIISLKSEEEFLKENGPDADYQSYFREKSQNAYRMVTDLHRMIQDIKKQLGIYKGHQSHSFS